MTSKIRYLLLGAGFIFFLIVSPVIVLYVRGIAYDFATKSFVQTGIFGIRTEPTDVNIYLNNKLARKSSGDVKFVLPGDYQITLTKDGYQTWNKRLTLTAGQVTWANPPNNNIYLLLSSPKSQNLASGVLDFYSKNNLLALLTAKSFSLTSLGNPQNQKIYPLSVYTNQILATDGSNNFLLTNNATTSSFALLLFNSKTGTSTDLSGLFSSLPTKLQFNGNGELFALSQNILYQINPLLSTKAEILAGVKAFYFQGNDLYYIAQKNQQLSLNLSQSPFVQSQTLLTNIPMFAQGALFVTSGKQIFLMADNSLYAVNSAMEKITGDISEADFDQANSSFALLHDGEFDNYDAFGQNLNYITRSGEALKNLAVNGNIGYAFYINNNGLNAIELDTRDTQNQYILYPSPTLQKFTIDNSGQSVLMLDNGELKLLTIR